MMTEMLIGALYRFEKHQWWLYPTEKVPSLWAFSRQSKGVARTQARFISERLGRFVDVAEQGTLFMVLEASELGTHKILTTDGRVGWARLQQFRSHFIEEVKVE